MKIKDLIARYKHNIKVIEIKSKTDFMYYLQLKPDFISRFHENMELVEWIYNPRTKTLKGKIK